MAKITPKENFLKMYGGGHPEYVPVYTLMGEGYMGEVADTMMSPKVFGATMGPDGGKDMWGVPHVPTEGTANAMMPDTRVIILPDIEEWRTTLKFPDIPKANEIDWESVYKHELAAANIDRTQTAVKMGPGLAPFQQLVNMMGFTDGLVALATNPDDVSEMLHAMVDFLEPYIERFIDVYKPDTWHLGDDTCAKNHPFFSPETYVKVFKPIYERLAKPARERGIPIGFHICGMMEPFMDFMVDFGVSMVEPTQETNDLLMLKEKYKGKVGFVGGWDWGEKRPLNYPEFDEEEMRQTVRDAMDKYAPGGGYGIVVWPISYKDDPVLPEIKRILRDECHWYGRKIYGYTGD